MRRRELIRLGLSGNPDTFITLTVNPDRFAGPDERAQRLKDAWSAVRRKACKVYGYTAIPFLAVFEKTKRGEPHLHILARCEWIDQAWLSEQMNTRIGAPIVDIRRINSRKKAAGYVAKYAGKNPERFQGTKRYWRSQDWEVSPHPEAEDEDQPKGDWYIVPERFGNYLAMVTAQGMTYEWRRHGVIIYEDGWSPWHAP
jgi:hypothetical protein